VPRRALRRLGIRAGAAALLCAGCLPDETPYWVIDHTDALTMRFEVVARGPYSLPPPPGLGPAAEALPGDRVRATPFIAGVDGPASVAALRPRWFACGGGGCGNADLRRLSEVPPCTALPLPLEETCAFGQTDAVEFELGPIVDVVQAANRGVILMMVAGTPEGPTTAECVQRARRLDEAPGSLTDCLFFVRTLRLGPTWLVVLVGALQGATSPLAPDSLPWQVSQIEADVAPRVDRFTAWVPAPGGGEFFVEVEPGGVLSVGTGEEIALALVEGAPPQEHYTVSIAQDSGAVTASGSLENRGAAWFSTTPAAFELTGGPGFEVSWRAPAEPGRALVYVVLADARSSTSAWLAVEVEAR
jgi:hypothetical protein